MCRLYCYNLIRRQEQSAQSRVPALLAAGGTDLLAMPGAERFGEETVYRVSDSALADPDHLGRIRTVDQRRILVSLLVGDLGDTESAQPRIL